MATVTREEVFEYSNGGLHCKSLVTFEEMRKKGEKVDVTIRCGTQSFSAHRIVLSAAIPYFRRLFCNNVSEAEMQVITIGRMDPVALECLVDYAYTSTVKITETNVEALLLSAKFLQITEVTESCCRYLSEHLSPENVIRTQKIAKIFKYTSLAKSVNIYIREHFDAMCRTTDFLSAPFPFVYDLLRRYDLNEEKVLEAVRKWLLADSERKRYLPKLPACVRIPLSSSYFTTRVGTDEPIRTITYADLVRGGKHSQLSTKAVLNMNSCTHSVLETKTWKHKPLMRFKPRDASGQSAFHVSKVKVHPSSSKKIVQGSWNSIDWENEAVDDWSCDETFNNTESECDDDDVENESCNTFSATEGVVVDSDTMCWKHGKAFRYNRRWKTQEHSYKRPKFRDSRKFEQKINYCDWVPVYDDSGADYYYDSDPY